MTSVPDDSPLSAAQVASLLGDDLPGPEAVVTAPALDLVRAARELVEAVVLTDVDDGERAAAAADLRGVAERLRARRRAGSVLLVRHDDGRIEHLTQAGSGRLNPQAPDIVFDGLCAPPSEPVPVELVARCTLTPSFGGPPGRVHGGQVAALLDEVVGFAAFVAGAPGMTVNLTVRYHRATPHSTPLEVRARLDRIDGRKRWASGEVVAAGEVSASAEAFLLGGPPQL
jgi:acyl-coenzyme A thioesterase PaaI-like protein